MMNNDARLLRTALYAGSFDPLTNGHVDIIHRASVLADRLVVAIGGHPGRAPVFSAGERAAMIRGACSDLPARIILDVVTFDGLAVEAARREGATLLIR